MDTLFIICGILAAFLLGCWTTHKAYQKESPLPKMIANIIDDLPEPISPYQEAKRQRVVKVKQ